jgi:hypothetical protein
MPAARGYPSPGLLRTKSARANTGGMLADAQKLVEPLGSEAKRAFLIHRYRRYRDTEVLTQDQGSQVDKKR